MSGQSAENVQPVSTLAGRYYTDQAIYHREMTALFARTWQYAGHESQVPDPGDFFAFDVAGQSLFCVRDEQRALHTFYNVCQHRAHELVHGAGNCRKVITCPYHAWSYTLDGRFLKGPNTEVVPGTSKDGICLTSVRTEVFCGFVFVNLDDSAAPMASWYPRVEQELRAFVPDIDALKPLELIRVAEKCNWKLSVENYSECYHCRINHKTFATGVIKPETYNIQPQGHCLRHTTECQNLDQMSYPIDLDSNVHAGHYSSWFLWPTFSFQVYPGNVLNTYHWQPVDVEAVDVWRGWYTVNGEESQVIRDLAIQDRQTTVEEDIDLVESQQRGYKSLGYRPGPLVIDPQGGVNSEHSVRVLQQWLREALEP